MGAIILKETVELKDGQLRSRNPAMNSALNLVNQDPTLLSAVQHMKHPVSLTLQPSEKLTKAFEIVQAMSTVESVPVRKTTGFAPVTEATPLRNTATITREVINATDITLAHLQQMLKHGAKSASQLTGDFGNGVQEKLYDALTTLQPSITSSSVDKITDHAIETALTSAFKRNPHTLAILNTLAMHQMSTQKEVDPQGHLASVGVSAGLGGGLEFFAIPLAKNLLKLGTVPSIAVDAMANLIVETLDSAIIASVVDRSKHKGAEKPKLGGLIKKNLPDAVRSGVFSFFGSIPKYAADTVLNPKTALKLAPGGNAIATIGATSILHPKMKEQEQLTLAAVKTHIYEGQFSIPHGESLDSFARQVTASMLRQEPGYIIQKESLPTALMFGSTVPTASDATSMPDAAKKSVGLTGIQPLEAHAMSALNLGHTFGIPGFIRADYHADLKSMSDALQGPLQGNPSSTMLGSTYDDTFQSSRLYKAGNLLSPVGAALALPGQAFGFITRSTEIPVADRMPTQAKNPLASMV